MKKTRKQLLGLAGLALVGIMTAIAYNLPAPGAAAVGSDATTEIQVKVGEQNPAGKFTSPANDSVTARSIIPVVFDATDAVKVEFFLIRRPTGTVTPAPNPGQRMRTRAVSDSEGELLHTCAALTSNYTCSFNFDAKSFDGYGEYIIRAIITDAAGVTYSVDTVAFSYDAIAIGDGTPGTKPGTDDRNNPVIEIGVSDSVERIEVTLYDKDGKQVLDKDGNPIIIWLTRADIDPATGKIITTLPFEKYGLKPGDYTVNIRAYDAAGQLITMSTTEVNYTPAPGSTNGSDGSGTIGGINTPDIPNTGILANGLNISRSDLIVTGLIAFTLASGFALVLVYRKKHSRA